MVSVVDPEHDTSRPDYIQPAGLDPQLPRSEILTPQMKRALILVGGIAAILLAGGHFVGLY